MTAKRAGVPLVHPGPRAPERIVSVPTGVSVLHAELPPGAGVADALWELTRDAGWRGASAELAHGRFGTLRYVHPAPSVDGVRPATFSETVEPIAPNALLTGSATVGTREGRGFAHVHAAWIDAEGRLRGGHLLPETTVGDVPIQVTLRGLPSVTLVSETDPETTLPAFTPHPVAAGDGTGRRAVMSRVRPGVDLHDAVLTIAAEAGFSSAVVRASLGSLVGATLHRGPGRVGVVDWPATEVTTLVGTVRGAGSADAVAELTASLVDVTGALHTGVLVPGRNPVAVTFELYLEEADHVRTAHRS